MRIVLFVPNWIGDVVMATPAIRAVRQRYPSATIDLIGRPYVAQVLEGAPWFDSFIPFDHRGKREHRFWAVWKKLRANPADLALFFPNSFRPAWLSWLAGIKRRVGFARYFRRILLTDALEPIRDERGRFKPSPIIDDYNRLVEAIGIDSPGHRMELFTTAKDDAAATDLWQRWQLHSAREVIGFNPGAAFGAAKHWPTESFAQLAQDLIDRRGSSILVFCGPNEREAARAIVERTQRKTIFSLADESVSLGLSKACIKRLDLLITTDSGPRHFAAAFNRPVISLFGPTFIDWTVTYFEKEICLQKKVPCGPCQQRVCPLDHRCMKDLTPTEVYSSAVHLLEKYAHERRRRNAS